MNSGCVVTSMRYYDVEGSWDRIKPHLGNKRLRRILQKDFNKFTFGRFGQRFSLDKVPLDFEAPDYHSHRPSPLPEYFDYTRHTACHWLVNFYLKLAMLVEPERPWRILQCPDHSTVWDGGSTLFDLNMMAMNVPPQETFEMARNGTEYPAGEFVEVWMPRHHTERAFLYPLAWLGYVLVISVQPKNRRRILDAEFFGSLGRARKAARILAKEMPVTDLIVGCEIASA